MKIGDILPLVGLGVVAYLLSRRTTTVVEQQPVVDDPVVTPVELSTTKTIWNDLDTWCNRMKQRIAEGSLSNADQHAFSSTLGDMFYHADTGTCSIGYHPTVSAITSVPSGSTSVVAPVVVPVVSTLSQLQATLNEANRVLNQQNQYWGSNPCTGGGLTFEYCMRMREHRIGMMNFDVAVANAEIALYRGETTQEVVDDLKAQRAAFEKAFTDWNRDVFVPAALAEQEAQRQWNEANW